MAGVVADGVVATCAYSKYSRNSVTFAIVSGALITFAISSEMYPANAKFKRTALAASPT